MSPQHGVANWSEDFGTTLFVHVIVTGITTKHATVSSVAEEHVKETHFFSNCTEHPHALTCWHQSFKI